MPDITIRKPRIIDPGYRVPDTQPEDTVCARVYIPNDILYIAAFWGHLFRLTQWLAWERGGSKARDAAEVWKAAWELSRDDWDSFGGECGDSMDVRQSSTAPCILEKTVDGEWVEFATLSLCTPSLRIRNGVIQQETSPGVWEDVSPENEPFEDRLHGNVEPLWTSPPAGETGNCLAASNASELLNVTAYTLANALGGVYEFTGLMSIVVGYLGGAATGIIGIISFFLLGVSAWLVESWNDIRDLDTTDELRELLHCLYGTDGVMSRENWDTAKARIDDIVADCVTDACVRRWNLLKGFIDIIGPVGMSRIAAASGIEESTCDDCPFDWVHTFDFTISDHDWTVQDYSGNNAGVYVPGVGWRGVWTGSNAFRIFILSPVVSSTNFMAMEFMIDWDESQRNYGNWWCGVITSGGDLVGPMISESGLYSPPPLPEGVYYGEASYTNQRLRFNCGNTKLPADSNNNGDVGGSTLSYIRVWGVGTDPF